MQRIIGISAVVNLANRADRGLWEYVQPKANQRGFASMWSEKSAKTGLLESIRRATFKVRALILHPRPHSCFDCGFLGYEGGHLSLECRVPLELWASTGVNAGLPSIEKIWCDKGLWISYAMNCIGVSADELQGELNEDRRFCTGWLPYRPGYSPTEHRSFQKERWQISANRLTVIIGAATGGIVGAIVSAIVSWTIRR